MGEGAVLLVKRLVCAARGHQPNSRFHYRRYCEYCWAVERSSRPWRNPYQPDRIYAPRHAPR